MKIILQNKEYIFLVGHQKDNRSRTLFDELTQKVFKLSFEAWYQAGYWNDKYIPYTLFDGNKAVANASINIMEFNVSEKQQRYIQIGTVATDPDYRNMGLSKFLMKQVLTDWSEKCDFIYLYANPSAVDFYPKFGFKIVKEYEYFKSLDKNLINGDCEKLNMDMQANKDMLYEYAKYSPAFSKLAMNENADLVMFYCASFLKENVYFIKSLNAIAVAVFKENQLQLWDVFSPKEVDLDKIIYALANSKIDEVVLGFTPKDASLYKIREIVGGDALYIQQDKTQLFEENKIMFPLLSHA